MEKNPLISGEEIQENFEAGINKYLLVNVVSRRSKQLIQGNPALVNCEGLATPIDVVSEEMRNSKLAVREEGAGKLLDAVLGKGDKDDDE